MAHKVHLEQHGIFIYEGYCMVDYNFVYKREEVKQTNSFQVLYFSLVCLMKYSLPNFSARV